MSAVRYWALLLVGFLASSSAQAGLVLTESNTGDSADGGSSRMVNRVSLEGDKLRSDVLEMSESNPMMGPGSYILMSGGTRVMTIVNPTARTYMRFDPKDFQGIQQGIAGSEQNIQEHGGQVEVSDLKLDKKVDEAGPSMLGMPTRHLVYELSYRRPMGVKAMGLNMDVTEKRELWVTTALDTKLASLSAFKAFAASISKLGSASTAQMEEVEKQIGANGFTVKSVTTSQTKVHSSIPNMMTMFVHGGGATHSTMEVTDLHEEPLRPDLFVVPPGFAEREMMNPNEGSMPDLNQMPTGKGQPPAGTHQNMPDLNNIPH